MSIHRAKVGMAAARQVLTALALALAVAAPIAATLGAGGGQSYTADGGDAAPSGDTGPRQPIGHITAPESQQPGADGTDSWQYSVTHGGIRGTEPPSGVLVSPHPNGYGAVGFGGGGW